MSVEYFLEDWKKNSILIFNSEVAIYNCTDTVEDDKHAFFFPILLENLNIYSNPSSSTVPCAS